MKAMYTTAGHPLRSRSGPAARRSGRTFRHPTGHQGSRHRGQSASYGDAEGTAVEGCEVSRETIVRGGSSTPWAEANVGLGMLPLAPLGDAVGG